MRCLTLKVRLLASRPTFTARFQSSCSLLEASNVDGVKSITLNDPKRRNALSLEMLNQLHSEINADLESTRTIVLRASGPVFCSGHDLKELRSSTGRPHHEHIFSRCTQLMDLIQSVPVPVVASVAGHAAAAGCQLVATCDVVVAAESAKFSTPGVNVGLFCSTPGIAVARAINGKKALEMLLTGWPITAQEALTHGLVSRVVADEQLEEQTNKLARRFCELSRPVLALGKRFYYEQRTRTTQDAYKDGCVVMVDNLDLRDCQHGIESFFDKAAPRWSHSDDTTK